MACTSHGTCCNDLDWASSCFSCLLWAFSLLFMIVFLFIGAYSTCEISLGTKLSTSRDLYL